MTTTGRDLIPVYRQCQDTLWSPCVTGAMCGICVAHLRGKKRNTPCLMLKPTEPAFFISIKQATGLLSDGLARPVNQNQAIQLLFSRLAHLRDASCKIDLSMLIAYADGQARARVAVDFGWAFNCEVSTWTPAMKAQSEERVQSFV